MSGFNLSSYSHPKWVQLKETRKCSTKGCVHSQHTRCAVCPTSFWCGYFLAASLAGGNGHKCKQSKYMASTMRVIYMLFFYLVWSDSELNIMFCCWKGLRMHNSNSNMNVPLLTSVKGTVYKRSTGSFLSRGQRWPRLLFAIIDVQKCHPNVTFAFSGLRSRAFSTMRRRFEVATARSSQSSVWSCTRTCMHG